MKTESYRPFSMFAYSVFATVLMILPVPSGATAIGQETPAQLPRQLIYCRFPLNDGGGNDATVLLQTVQTLVDFLHADNRTIIACSAGMSRSPTIAAFALAAHLSQEPEEVIGRIADIKPLELKAALWNEVANVFSRVRRST